MSNQKTRRGEKKNKKQSNVQGKRPEPQSPSQGKQVEYQQREGRSRTSREVRAQADSRAVPARVGNAVN